MLKDMALIPEITFLNAYMHFHRPSFPTPFTPPAGTFGVVYVASGLLSGVLHLPQGLTAYRAPGRIGEGVMLLVPPGAVFDAVFNDAHMEAYRFLFSCDVIELDSSGMRYVLALPDGGSLRLDLVHRLSAHEVVIFRPVTEWICKHYYAKTVPGAHLRAQFLFQALFSTFFAIKGVFATHEGDAAQQLEKLIEMEGHRVKFGEMARELHHSPSWLRARFKEAQGTTPLAAREAQTLHLAQYYIRQTKLPFRQIALRLGMSSASYFSYYVRRHLGASPRQLRRAAARDGRGFQRGDGGEVFRARFAKSAKGFENAKH